MTVSKLLPIAVLAAATFSAPAMAQADDYEGSFFIGPQVGYHDFQIDDDEFDGALDINDGGFLVGGVLGLDVPIGETPAVFGFEADANFGTDAIDSDFGAVAYLGYNMTEQFQIQARGGWRWVRIDPFAVVGATPGQDPILDNELSEARQSADDYSVGLGARYSMGNIGLRAAVDTVSFDTIRGTVALVVVLR